MTLPNIKSVDFDAVIKIVLSGNGREDGYPVTVKGKPCICFEKIKENKAFHENIPLENLESHLEKKIDEYGNLTIITEGRTYGWKIPKKRNKILFNTFNNIETKKASEKNHVLTLDIPPLYELGIATKDGKLISGMRDKYVQADRFADFIIKAVSNLEKRRAKRGEEKKNIRIVDAGCGKAYLSLAVYHHLKYVLNKDVSLVGIDLKKDVIKNLNEVAKKYGYDSAEFICADLKTASFENTDILISLHACDVATDYALYGGIENGVPVILSAPCCQRELCAKMKTPLGTIEKYGLIKERSAALFTDALRAEILSAVGYKTRITEFVGAHNTPKNLLIIAEKTAISEKINAKSLEICKKTIDFLGADITLYRLLEDKFSEVSSVGTRSSSASDSSRDTSEKS